MKLKINETPDEMSSENRAYLSMSRSKESVIQDRIRERNAQSRLDAQLRKERLNDRFWHRVYVSAHIFAALLVIYTIFHFVWS